MPEQDDVHLPTEIVVKIAEILYYAKYTTKRTRELASQQQMYKFCLVSRQWYSAGIAFLYKKPQLFGGNRFANFTRTICPPSREKKTAMELGSKVESLWLDKLVHHSSNSMTARLLSRTHQGLVEFVAPRVSFSLNGLTALSKCHKLRLLNLNQVASKSITFPRLKKAISNLSNLEGLHLPPRIPLTSTSFSDGKWPSSLTAMKVGGCIDDNVMCSFEWPIFLEELTLTGLKSLGTMSLEYILLGPYLAGSLKRLIISSDYDSIEPLEFTPAIYSLTKLTYLECPIDLLEPLGILMRPTVVSSLTLNLKELRLLSSRDESILEEDFLLFAESMREALNTNLSHIISMQVPTISSIDLLPDVWKELNHIVLSNLENLDDSELDDLGLVDEGIEFCEP